MFDLIDKNLEHLLIYFIKFYNFAEKKKLFKCKLIKALFYNFTHYKYIICT